MSRPRLVEIMFVFSLVNYFARCRALKQENKSQDLSSTMARTPLSCDFNVGTISMLHEAGGRVAGAAGEGNQVMGAAETCHSIYHSWDGPSTEPNALFYHRFPP